jgi:hypothetical protein
MNADLHDAELVGVAYEANKCIRLTFAIPNAGRVELVLIGVHRFAANHLWDGNIVLDVMSTKFGTLDPGAVPQLAADAFPEEFDAQIPAREHGTRNQWQHWLQQIEQGQLHALVVEPSYGAEVIAICTDIRILKTD